MGSSSAQTVGYKYDLGMHMIFCHGPIDKVTKIEFDDKVAWQGNSTGGDINVSAENLFGGEEREGGVSGLINLEMGSSTQPPNSYLASKLGGVIPAFRGVVGAVFNQFYMGMNPYLKTPAFWGTRIHVRQNGIAQWYDSKAAIGNDMNPAHIIRECITDPNWGMGYLEADIDDVSFTTAADLLYSEGMGISLLWDSSVAIDEFIQEVLKHIDGSLFVDRTTGKFKLKLARDDYTIGSLLLLDEDSIDKISDFKRSTIDELVNSVTVVYTDGTTGENNSVTVQDIALIAQQQCVISSTKQFPGFSTGAIATKVAERSLRALSVPVASCVIYTNRKAANLNIGDVFVMNWQKYGVSNLVMRVTNIELGSLDSNTVKIDCIEDVFSISSAIYSPPPPSGWTDPNHDPAPCLYHNVIEAPYWELVQQLGETAVSQLDVTSGFIAATGVKPTSDAVNMRIASNPYNTGYTEYGVAEFCPTAILSASITPNQTIIPISSGSDLDLVTTGTYAIIDNEIVSIISLSTSSMTVGRGCLDTVPASHSSSARIFFSDTSFGTDRFEYSQGETARIKLLPTTGKGTLLVTSAPEQTVTIQARQSKPYPPGKLRINTLAYPDSVAGDQDIVVAWAHRDRLQQTASLIDTEAGSIGPETNTEYICRVLTKAGTVIATHSAITTTTTTFSLAELGSNYGRLRIQLWSTRDGIQSYQMHDWEFTRSGYGTGYGYSYGGI